MNAETAEPLRIWGDLVKAPSLFVRNLRFVQDYQTVRGCAEPLRLLLSARTIIAGRVELSAWLRPAPEQADDAEHTCTSKNGDQARE